MSPPPAAPPPHALLPWPREQPLHRIFRPDGGGGPRRSPVHFARSGPKAGNRFDAPDRQFGTLYAGASLRCAVIETVLRPANLDDGMVEYRRQIGARELDTRSAARLLVPRPLRLLKLFDAGLHALGLDARISASIDYEWTQARALDLFERFDADGLAWRSRLDNGEIAVVLFEERIPSGFTIEACEPLTADALAQQVQAMLDAFGCTVTAEAIPPAGIR